MLTPKQQRFVEEYLIDLNATQAAIRAGYSKKTARQIGEENLSKPDIRDAVDKLKRERSGRTLLTADDVLKGIAEIATVDIGQAINEDGTLKPIHEIPEPVRRAISGIDIQEIKAGEQAVGTVKRIRFWSKDKAFEMLGRHLELFTDKVKHEGLEGLADALAKRRKRAASGD